MTNANSRLSISELENGITRIAFRDQNILEESAIHQITEEVSRLIGGSPNPKLLISFTGVEHLSSAALGALIAIKNKVSAKGGQLRLSNIDPQIYEVFRITRLNTLFQIHDTEETALTSFR